MTDTNGWTKAEMHVFNKLESHDADFKSIWKLLDIVRQDIRELKVKMAGFVLVATVAATAVATIIAHFIGRN